MSTRSSSGSVIAETGPALFILLVFIIFPLLDLLYLGAGYLMAWTLHREEIRQVAVHKPAEWSMAVQNADDQYINGPFGNFLKLERTPPVAPTFTPTPENPTAVRLLSQMKIKPLLIVPIPGLSGVPGLNAPIELTFDSERPQEEKGRD